MDNQTKEEAIQDLKKEVESKITILRTNVLGNISLAYLRGVQESFPEDLIVAFAKWYSGMDEAKVRSAYRRYKKEVSHPQA